MNLKKILSGIWEVVICIIYMGLLVSSFVYGGNILKSPDIPSGQVGKTTMTYAEGNILKSPDIPSGLTYLTIAFLAVCTWFDVCDTFGASFFIPKLVSKRRKEKIENQINDVIKKSLSVDSDYYTNAVNYVIEKCFSTNGDHYKKAVSYVIETYYGENFERFSELLEAYFKKDYLFALNYNKERINYVLNQLGITKTQYDDLLVELAKLRAMPLKSVEDAINRVKMTLPSMVIKQDDEQTERVYPNVQYYVDFISIMRDDGYRKQIAKSFASFIRLSMGAEQFRKITKIIIPEDSNYLLGFRVGETLGLPQVIVRGSKGRIVENQPWDGHLESQDRVIIIHDVLVTGEQIIKAIEKIKNIYEGIEFVGLYCIVRRTDFDGKEKIKTAFHTCKIVSMIELNDDIIEKEYYRQ